MSARPAPALLAYTPEQATEILRAEVKAGGGPAAWIRAQGAGERTVYAGLQRRPRPRGPTDTVARLIGLRRVVLYVPEPPK